MKWATRAIGIPYLNDHAVLVDFRTRQIVEIVDKKLGVGHSSTLPANMASSLLMLLVPS